MGLSVKCTRSAGGAPESAAAMMCYTSGTTGHPKGAMITHGILGFVALGWVAEIMPLRRTDVTQLTVEKAGYKKSVSERVTVNAENVQGLDVILEIGEITAVVTIADEATQQLETENANINKAITTNEVMFGRKKATR